MNISKKTVVIVGGGPAGLIAAEILAPHAQVTVYDRMPSLGRKLLMAGRGGLNLTHSEPMPGFLARYGAAAPALASALDEFSPEALVSWAEGLGQEVFTGSSGRIFPRAMKSSPLLRAWLARLSALGVTFRARQEWLGWTEQGSLRFAGPEGASEVTPDATLLALGGASWPRLGSTGAWAQFLPQEALAPFQPANMGFSVAWSDMFSARHAGSPLKRIGLTIGDRSLMGEAMVTKSGIEGGVIYALSSVIRDAIAANGPTTVHLDLRPDLSLDALQARLPASRGSQSLSNFLRARAGLSPAAIGLVQEALHKGASGDLATLIKALPLQLEAPFGLERAISSAGGVRLDAVDASLMLTSHPGVFAAGEMLDWEAPTGGYLLQACLSTGSLAAQGVLAWLERLE